MNLYNMLWFFLPYSQSQNNEKILSDVTTGGGDFPLCESPDVIASFTTENATPFGAPYNGQNIWFKMVRIEWYIIFQPNRCYRIFIDLLSLFPGQDKRGTRPSVSFLTIPRKFQLNDNTLFISPRKTSVLLCEDTLQNINIALF